MSGPLQGFTIIELEGIGPCPYAGQLLSDMGANVIVVQRPGGRSLSAAGLPMIDQRGKTSIVVDLKSPDGRDILLRLIKQADALIEGNRPGVLERLGLGPDMCQATNPKLVFGRMTGWGQTGPWAKTAGHDLNYIGLTGALHAMGPSDRPPSPPLNLLGDYGGGSLFLVSGVLAALLKAQKTGQGDIVDCAIIDGVSSMMGLVYSLSAFNLWKTDRASNLLDGAMPYYRCYETKDGKYMAVGCIEPQFFALMLEILELDPAAFGGQNDPTQHAGQIQILETLFKSKTRSDWSLKFDGTDACVTPVLNYIETQDHPQNAARGGLQKSGLHIHPAPAPAFASTVDKPEIPPLAIKGADTATVLKSFGFSQDEIKTLEKNATIQINKSS